MHLIQLLLPLYDNDGQPVPKKIFHAVSTELTEKYGGLTSFVRSPAVGLWKEMEDKTVKDDIVIYEVMVQELDTAWWRSYKEQLCRLFGQQEMIIRATPIQLL